MSATITVIEREKVEQINRAHRAVEQSYGETLSHAIDCGRMLAAVKVDLSHGEWGPWIDEHFEGSERTARVYMQLASSPELERQSAADLSIAGALKQVQKPRTPSGSEVTTMLRGMSGSDTSSRASVTERLDGARDRLRSEASITWGDSQTRKRHRVIDQLEASRSKLDTAAGGGLSKYGIAEALREAAVEAHHAASALDELAFTFER